MCWPSPIFKPGNLRCVKFDSMLSRFNPTKGVKGDPRGLQCMSIFPSPHPLSSRKLKKAFKLPSHRYLPTPTTFHFLPPPYIFVPISPSSLLFQTISPSSLLCTSPLLSVARQPTVLHLRKPISWHLHPPTPPPQNDERITCYELKYHVYIISFTSRRY